MDTQPSRSERWRTPRRRENLFEAPRHFQENVYKGQKQTMEKKELEQELSSLMEVTLRLEDELNYITMNRN